MYSILYASKEIRTFFIENFPRTIYSTSFFHNQILFYQSFEVFFVPGVLIRLVYLLFAQLSPLD